MCFRHGNFRLASWFRLFSPGVVFAGRIASGVTARTATVRTRLSGECTRHASPGPAPLHQQYSGWHANCRGRLLARNLRARRLARKLPRATLGTLYAAPGVGTQIAARAAGARPGVRVRETPACARPPIAASTPTLRPARNAPASARRCQVRGAPASAKRSGLRAAFGTIYVRGKSHYCRWITCG